MSIINTMTHRWIAFKLCTHFHPIVFVSSRSQQSFWLNALLMTHFRCQQTVDVKLKSSLWNKLLKFNQNFFSSFAKNAFTITKGLLLNGMWKNIKIALNESQSLRYIFSSDREICDPNPKNHFVISFYFWDWSVASEWEKNSRAKTK